MTTFRTYEEYIEMIERNLKSICYQNAAEHGFSEEEADECEADNHICEYCPFER